MDWSKISDIANTLGVVGMLVTVLYGGMRGWWVFGYIYQEIKADRDEWKHIAQTNIAVAEQALKALKES